VSAALRQEALVPLQVGATAPDFQLKDQNNQLVRLSDFHGTRTVLLIFYPLAFTNVCQGELAALPATLTRFPDVQALTVSVDSVFAHKVWADQQGYDFPLLADFWPHGAVARDYGVFNDERGYANRGTFIIDPSGVIRFAEMNLPGDPRDQSAWQQALDALPTGG
jgi:mycoredoxin-dependent peroxiredoxin